ncbi:MAG: hypothetical protein AAFR21_05295 [Pseudomonadota bacterium]
MREEIVLQLQDPKSRQVVVICDSISNFSAGLAVMALEIGYDTFLVCPSINNTPMDVFTRLATMGVKLVSCDRFLEECAFSAAPLSSEEA